MFLRITLSMLVVGALVSGCSKGKKPEIVDNDSTNLKGVIQNTEPLPSAQYEAWAVLDPEKDKAQGVSADRVYAELNPKFNEDKPLIVAVIDSGVDTQHEDLQGKIWVNKNEIPDNGKDDDNNGYVDDIHGWNYIGGTDANGKVVHIEQETLEMTRELVKMKAKDAAAKSKGEELSADDQAYFDKLQEAVKEERDYATDLKTKAEAGQKAVAEHYDALKTSVAFDKLTVADVEAIQSTEKSVLDAKAAILEAFKKYNAKNIAKFIARIEYANGLLNFYLNEEFNPRAAIVKDDPENYELRGYGNNDIMGRADGASHGTHVSGMIAAKRDNQIGIQGIASNVEIMGLRAVPDGDERDKDVAFAVRYAADNGAKIINMSFGKAFSPGKGEVDKAFEYAASKGVLIVHAAGNSSLNIDEADNFPNRYFKADAAKEVSTWLEVGASARTKDQTMAASFSNYGKKSVDLFAPGVDCYSSVPGNQYASYSGTSMASPAAAGAAALIWSARPELTAIQVKEILLEKAISHKGLGVLIPGSTENWINFSNLSRTGAIANSFESLKKFF